MRDILEDFLISPLLRAMEANIHEAWIRLGHGLGAVVHDEPELLWFLSELPFHLANGIVRTRFPPDIEEETLEKRLKQLTSHGVPMAWLIGPSTSPMDLGNRLEKHGWFHDDEAPGMAVDLRSLGEHPSQPPGLIIQRVRDAEMLKTWLRVMTIGSEIPEEGLAALLNLALKHPRHTQRDKSKQAIRGTTLFS